MRPGIALSRRSRALAVTAATLAIAAASAAIVGPEPGIAMGGLAAAVLTLVTVPDDLRPGERDSFGLAVLAALILAGIAGLATERQPRVIYDRFDDPN